MAEHYRALDPTEDRFERIANDAISPDSAWQFLKNNLSSVEQVKANSRLAFTAFNKLLSKLQGSADVARQINWNEVMIDVNDLCLAVDRNSARGFETIIKILTQQIDRKIGDQVATFDPSSASFKLLAYLYEHGTFATREELLARSSLPETTFARNMRFLRAAGLVTNDMSDVMARNEVGMTKRGAETFDASATVAVSAGHRLPDGTLLRSLQLSLKGPSPAPGIFG